MALDKFYTNADVVERCVESLFASADIEPDDIIIEPSAGAGAFVRALARRHAPERLVAMDIAPDADGIEARDYLLYEPDRGRAVHVVGNPPFGYLSRTANSFIRHSARFAKNDRFYPARVVGRPLYAAQHAARIPPRR